MKKQFSKVWVCLTMMLAVFAMPAMATTETVSAQEVDIFKLDIKDPIKVAPRDPHDRCKTHPESQPYCPKKKKKTDSGTFSVDGLAKLKCQKAKTCDDEETENSILGWVKRLLS